MAIGVKLPAQPAHVARLAPACASAWPRRIDTGKREFVLLSGTSQTANWHFDATTVVTVMTIVDAG